MVGAVSASANSSPPVDPDWHAAARALPRRGLVALCGAGMSTDSGIPDYRGEKTRRLARQPMRGETFLRDPEARRRYWARAIVGWPRMRDAQPNAAHRALARLEDEGALLGTITQNVDGLHHRAGAREIVELHGALREVACLHCGQRRDRSALQAELDALNPELERGARQGAWPLNPDGDAELPEALVAATRVVDCAACGGPLKPCVVYFGESVPAARVARAYAMLDRAEALLVLGSSLAVFSGYRFVRRARERDLPVVIVNRGPTRGDPLASVKVDAGLGDFLPWWLAAR